MRAKTLQSHKSEVWSLQQVQAKYSLQLHCQVRIASGTFSSPSRFIHPIRLVPCFTHFSCYIYVFVVVFFFFFLFFLSFFFFLFSILFYIYIYIYTHICNWKKIWILNIAMYYLLKERMIFKYDCIIDVSIEEFFLVLLDSSHLSFYETMQYFHLHTIFFTL